MIILPFSDLLKEIKYLIVLAKENGSFLKVIPIFLVGYKKFFIPETFSREFEKRDLAWVDY